jgi:hypothetical protein
MLAPQNYTIGTKQDVLNGGVPLSVTPSAGPNRKLEQIIFAGYPSDGLCLISLVLWQLPAEPSKVLALNEAQVYFSEATVVLPDVSNNSRASAAREGCGGGGSICIPKRLNWRS